MHVIGFVAQKGGGGKTTLASSLAVHAVSRKSTVGLLDMDPQQSLAEWYERRGQPKNPQLYTGVDTASGAIELLGAEGLDYLFIDTGPGLFHAIEPVIAVSDLIVVPVKASEARLDGHSTHARGGAYSASRTSWCSTKTSHRRWRALQASSWAAKNIPSPRRSSSNV